MKWKNYGGPRDSRTGRSTADSTGGDDGDEPDEERAERRRATRERRAVPDLGKMTDMWALSAAEDVSVRTVPRHVAHNVRSHHDRSLSLSRIERRGTRSGGNVR